MAKLKRIVTDAQFKHQVIFTIKGMQANLKKIEKMFPEAALRRHNCIGDLFGVIDDIKNYKGVIVRRPRIAGSIMQDIVPVKK